MDTICIQIILIFRRPFYLRQQPKGGGGDLGVGVQTFNIIYLRGFNKVVLYIVPTSLYSTLESLANLRSQTLGLSFVSLAAPWWVKHWYVQIQVID